MTVNDLPIIDLSPLFEETQEGLRKVASELGHAARTIGFFYVKNHAVDKELIKDVFAASKAFFDLEEDAKRELAKDFFKTNRGYVPINGECLDPTKSPDLKEAFNIGLDLQPEDPRILSAEPFRAVNLWPNLPMWRDIMLQYYNVLWSLGRQLHKAIAVDLDAPQDYFEDKLDAPMATLRLLHYPPQTDHVKAGQIGAGLHTDYGNLTILLPDETGGLEVQRRDGTWIEAPTIEDTFLCNIGDCLMRWTNDIYVSTPHRVINSAEKDRYSIAFFLDPNPEAEVFCLEGCQSPDRPSLYPPVSAAEYLQMKLDAAYDPVKGR